MNTWAVPGYTESLELGSGASGRVVLAVHEETGLPVAVKYLSESLRTRPGFVRDFRAEARLLGGLESPYVAGLYEYVESPDGAAIVMELVDGVSVADPADQEGPLGPEAALVVLKGSLLGLADAHRIGVVHRDYKPENVLVVPDGSSKLVDFGIAVDAGTSVRRGGNPLLHGPGAVDRRARLPRRRRVRGHGHVLRVPDGPQAVRGDNLAELALQHVDAPVPAEEAPEAVRELVRRGLAKDPGNGPPTPRRSSPNWRRPPAPPTGPTGRNAAAAGSPRWWPCCPCCCPRPATPRGPPRTPHARSSAPNRHRTRTRATAGRARGAPAGRGCWCPLRPCSWASSCSTLLRHPAHPGSCRAGGAGPGHHQRPTRHGVAGVRLPRPPRRHSSAVPDVHRVTRTVALGRGDHRSGEPSASATTDPAPDATTSGGTTTEATPTSAAPTSPAASAVKDVAVSGFRQTGPTTATATSPSPRTAPGRSPSPSRGSRATPEDSSAPRTAPRPSSAAAPRSTRSASTTPSRATAATGRFRPRPSRPPPTPAPRSSF